jgi:hypothetical protein
MLKTIVAISGKPGLYKVLSQGKNMLIVESLTDGKRMPAHSSEKVVSLGDISMFTDDEDKPLHEILESMKTLEKGARANIDPKSDNEALKTYFALIVPNFDRERVYPSDIRKLVIWYNLLIETGMTDFAPKEAPEGAAEVKVEEAAEVKEVEEVKVEKAPEKAAKVKADSKTEIAPDVVSDKA